MLRILIPLPAPDRRLVCRYPPYQRAGSTGCPTDTGLCGTIADSNPADSHAACLVPAVEPEGLLEY